MAGRGRWWTARRLRVLLAVVVVALAVETWFPFRLELPLWERWAPTVVDGALHFDGRAVLSADAEPTWLATARRTGQLDVELEARSASPDQDGPARLLTISSGFHHANLTVGQEDADLVVRLRRPGSDDKGATAYVVPEVFADQAWHAIDVAVQDASVTVVIDGRLAVRDDLASAVIASWSGGYRVALGDEPQGDRGWAGDVRTARVEVPGLQVDLLAPGVLEGGHGVALHSRLGGLNQITSRDPLVVMLVRALAFVPVGLVGQLLWGRRRRAGVLAPTAVVVGLAAVLLVGKVFVAGRHPVLSDALLSVVGGLAGVGLGVRRARRGRVEAGVR